jgi:hypothetical protein
MARRARDGAGKLGSIGCVAALLVAAACSHGPRGGGFRPPVPGFENFIERAVFAGGRLWLLTDSGELSSIIEGTETRAPESLPGPVADLCLRNGVPTVATCDDESCPDWTVRSWNAGQWSVVATVPSRGERLLAMSCANGETVLLTYERLIDVRDGKTESVTISEAPVKRGRIASVDVEGDQIYVGVSAGEWGGGLRRIDRRTGRVTVIERNATGVLCDGPLNTDCDPVNGLAREPWRSDCVAAAVGLVHMMRHGRLIEVCSDRVDLLYFKPYTPRSIRHHPNVEGESFGTVAFFGLVRSGDELLAVGIDGIYRLRDGKLADVVPLPAFKFIGGVAVSFELPDVVLVSTAINGRHSLSGDTPMLVPR